MSTQIDRIGVVGAGFMGTGIAESAARAGVLVRLYEPETAALDRSREALRASTDRAVERGKLDADAAGRLLANIVHTDDLEDLADAPLVIEAIVEDEAIKRDVFARLDTLLGPEAILASNTSSIPIAGLAAATARPDRVLGLHFFSPVPVMSLVEIVVAIDTAEEAVAAAEAFARRIDKHPIRSRDRAGFVVNFLLVPYLMAAVRMLEEGFADREAIDEGMRRGCGHPMGPLALCDLIGLDVLDSVCESLHDEFRRPEYAAPPLLRRMVVAGHLGRKSGRGFYAYDG